MSKIIERDSNFELLRIVAIFMVLILHYFNGGMGGAFNNVKSGTLNYYFMYFIESLSIIAVNLFVLISGYFMCTKKETKISKVLNLILLTSFYSVVFYILSIFLGSSNFSLRELVYSMIPFTYGSKWFISTYVVLSLISPYLNVIFERIDEVNMRKLVLILIITISITPTLLNKLSYNDNGYGVLSFIMLYTIGAYIRLHFKKDKKLIFYLSSYILFTIFTFIYAQTSERAWDYNSIFNVMSSISLFLVFAKIKLKSTIINTLATYSFAIYVVHTEPRINVILYQTILKCNQFWSSDFFVLHMLISIMLIYSICILIEYLRRKVFVLIKFIK